MTIVSHVLSFPGLTIAAILQSLLAIRFLPGYVDSHSHLFPIAFIFLVNYGFGVIFWVFIYPVFFSPLRHLPGPRNPFNIVLQALIAKERPSGDLFLDIAEKYPGEELISLDFLRHRLLVTNAHLLSDILVRRCYDFAKPSRIRAFLRHVLGDGLVTVEGDQHKFLRKNINPPFHFRHINDMYPMMWTKAGILVKTLRKEGINGTNDGSKGPRVVELNAWASKVTLDIIGIAGMGRGLNVVEKEGDPLQDIYMQLTEPTREKLIFGMLSFAFGFSLVRLLPWKMNRDFIHLTTSLDRICQAMIYEKRDAMLKRADDHFDILSLLIRSNAFSDEVIKDQLLTFLAAGHETTASSLTWASYLLAKHPDIQAMLRDEISQALPTDTLNNPPADLPGVLRQLPYLNGVIQETLRLFPTVPITRREALRDTQVGDHFIPKGTDMVLSIWMTNRSPAIWGPYAGDFRPQRWITDGRPNQDGGARSNYDFLTFLHGPRSCIGQEFARAEMRCLLAALVMSFTWELAMEDAKVVPKGVITIKPENGMYLKLTPIILDD